jgi:probable F420-dependent oxidoreductase
LPEAARTALQGGGPTRGSVIMEFGINTGARGIMSTRAAYMQIAQLAERSGYDFLSVSDHVIVPDKLDSTYPYSEGGRWETAAKDGFCFDVLSTLIFLAGCTEKLKLLSSVLVVPYRPPVLTAKMLSTADILSEGRIILGIGAGWLEEEFLALGAEPYDKRGKVTDEYIEAFKVLWSEDKPAYNGDHVDIESILFAPKPYDGRSIPVWVGGESNPAMRRTARLGDAWYPGSRNPKHRLDTPERLKAGLEKLAGMAEKEGRDPATIDIAYVYFEPVSFEAVEGFDTPRAMMTGSAEEMAGDVCALGEVGVTKLNLTFPARSLDEMSDTIQRFAEDVMPLVRG